MNPFTIHAIACVYAQAAAHQVEELIVADLGDVRLVADLGVTLTRPPCTCFVSEIESSSRMSASQRTKDLPSWRPRRHAPCLRYVAWPPSFEIDFETMVELVSGAQWNIFAPVSRILARPRVGHERDLTRRLRTHQYTDGYFIVKP